MVLMAFNCLRYFADKPMGSKYTWGANTFWPPAHLNSWDILRSTWILWSRAIIFQCLSHSCDLPFFIYHFQMTLNRSVSSKYCICLRWWTLDSPSWTLISKELMFSSQGSSSPTAFESSWKLMHVHVSSYKFIYELVWAQKIMWANHLEHALPSYKDPKQLRLQSSNF